MTCFSISGSKHYCYAEQPREEVALDLLVYVNTAAGEALKELGLDPQSVTVRYFRAGDVGESSSFVVDGESNGLYGRHRPGEIFVRIGRPVGESVETVCHEARHCWQNATGFMSQYSRAQCEEDATAWARQFVASRPDLVPRRA